MASDTLRGNTLLAEAKKVEPPPFVIDTPVRPTTTTSQGSDNGFQSVLMQLRPALMAEFEGHIYEDNTLKDRAFANIPSALHIQSFLDNCPLYDSEKKRWAAVPRVALHENDELYTSLTKVIRAIVNHPEFGLSTQRKAEDTHTQWMFHNEGAIVKSQPSEVASGGATHTAVKQLKSSPDISILGVVPDEKVPNNFPVLKETPTDFYYSLLSPVEVKTEKNFNLDQNTAQICVYARQIYRHQSNRFVVNSLLLTESNVRLFVHGREALHHTTAVNIHEDAVTFVRFILGAASTDGKVAGYDESIYWQDGQRYIKTVDKDNNEVVHKLIDNRPIFDQRSIRGRGTCCWAVRDKEGRLLIIKDAWRSTKRSPEWEMMQKVEGLEGVGQMIAFQDRIAILSDLRDLDLDAMVLLHNNKMFRDRILSRLILVCYNGSIDQFRSRTELLHTFRDAVAGHQNLWNAGILHRDISTNNILIGYRNGEKGKRGFLIDLDMAIFLARTDSLNGLDFRTGTRAYQSVNVLKSYIQGKTIWPHNFMDDLESFFYVLCWICCGYDSPNKRIKPFPSFLAQWEEGNPELAFSFKFGLYSEKFSLPVSMYFGEIFQTLLFNLHAIFHKLFADRFFRSPDLTSHPTSEKVQLEASAAYSTFLGHVDAAVAKLEAIGEEKLQKDFEEKLQKDVEEKAADKLLQGSSVLAKTPTQATFSHRTSQKRSSHEDEESDSERRKKRVNAPHTSSKLSQSDSGAD